MSSNCCNQAQYSNDHDINCFTTTINSQAKRYDNRPPYLLRRLEGLKKSFMGHDTVVGRRGFGQITSSSFPSTRNPERGRLPSLMLSGRLSNELHAPANCWTPPIFLAISSFTDLKPSLHQQYQLRPKISTQGAEITFSTFTV